MQISKVATAVALSTGLLFGCNSDGLPVPTDPVAPSPELKITSGYWQLGTAASAASFSTAGTDLPNVYVFSEDGNHKYYDDDATPGTYVIKDASASTNDYDEDAGTISFMLYDGGTTMEVSGEFTLTEASDDTPASMTFIDEDQGVDLSGSDEVDNDSVKDAVTKANEDNGINNVVQILDTNFGGTKNDVGELRLKLSESATVSSIASGKLSVDLIYQVDTDTSEEANDNGNNAYISLYGSGTSNTNLHGEIIFNAGEIFYRSTATDSSGKPQISDQPVGTYELGEDLAVEVSWANGYYTFTINDTVYDNNGNGFESFDKSAVTVISLKLGDTSNTTHYELIADNLAVYSNDETDNQVVFEDDFDSYVNGAVLGGSDPYNNNSAEATVVTEGEGPTDPTDPVPGEVTDDFESYTAGIRIDAANSAYVIKGDKEGDDETTIVAEVSTEQANSGDKSLLLHDNSTAGKPVVSRTFKNGGAESGSVSMSVFIPSEGYVKSTYLFLGSSDTASSSKRFTEVAFGSSTLKFRNESGSQKDLAPYAHDTWVDVTMAWEPNSDSSAYDVTITVDGKEYTSYEEDGTTYPLVAEADEGAPVMFAAYVGDNSSSGTYSYFDDLDSELF